MHLEFLRDVPVDVDLVIQLELEAHVLGLELLYPSPIRRVCRLRVRGNERHLVPQGVRGALGLGEQLHGLVRLLLGLRGGKGGQTPGETRGVNMECS